MTSGILAWSRTETATCDPGCGLDQDTDVTYDHENYTRTWQCVCGEIHETSYEPTDLQDPDHRDHD